MKKLVMMLAFLLCFTTVMAEEAEKKASPGMTSWLKSMQERLSRITPRKNVSMTTSVAGVRGAKEDSAAGLYWKGKKGEEPVTEEEMTKFKACIDMAEKGERDGALKQLEDFMKLYPDSPLIPDAKKTYDLLKAEPQVEAPKAQPVAEEKKIEVKPGQKQEDKKETEKNTQQ